MEEIAPGNFRLLHSPGLVQDIAAGDEFRLIGDDGKFEVSRRGGNLCIQVYSPEPVALQRAELADRVGRLGGWLDGAVERGLVFTVPVSAGFLAVEVVFNTWVEEHPGWEWFYGNVYDSDDSTPLKWWE